MDNKAFSIVIIDDEPSIRNGIENIIRNNLNDVIILGSVSSGEEGLNLILEKRPNLVISDIVMPKKTGLDILQYLRENNNKTPFILISGYDEFKYAHQAIRLGVSAYILKPISPKELINTIIQEKERCKILTSISKIEDEYVFKSTQRMFLERLLRGEIKSEEEAVKGIKAFELKMNKTNTVMVIKGENSISIDDFMHISINHNDVYVIPYDEDYALHIARLIYKENPSLAISVGQQIELLSSLHISYQKALLALSYSMYCENGGIFTQSDIKDDSPTISTGDIDTIQLKSLLICGTCDEIKAWVDNFFTMLDYTSHPSPSFIKGMAIFLMTDIQKQLMSSMDMKKEDFGNIDAFSISKMFKFSEIKEYILTNLIWLNQKAIPQAKIANDPIIFKVKNIIKNKPGLLSSCDIATQIGISTTYLSQYFKSKTGENLRTYSNRIIIKEAKRLLLETDLSVDEIASKLGYADYRSFHRLFKNITHISPSTFKKKSI